MDQDPGPWTLVAGNRVEELEDEWGGSRCGVCRREDRAGGDLPRRVGDFGGTDGGGRVVAAWGSARLGVSPW